MRMRLPRAHANGGGCGARTDDPPGSMGLITVPTHIGSAVTLSKRGDGGRSPGVKGDELHSDLSEPFSRHRCCQELWRSPLWPAERLRALERRILASSAQWPS